MKPTRLTAWGGWRPLHAGFVSALCAWLAGAPTAAAEEERRPKVLVVMSYHQEYYWCEEIKRGIESVVRQAELRFVYLDMKNHPEGGADRAREARAVVEEWKPDGIIAADDYAQSAFVVPYLKDRVTTPVVFCGVNNAPEDYGYPASNVTGVLERYYAKESMALLKRLVPGLRNVCVIMRGNEPSTAGVIKQMKGEASTYALKVLAFREPASLAEAVAAAQELKGKCDAFFLEHFEGLADRDGTPRSNESVVRVLVKVLSGKPVACANTNTVRAGCLAAVVESGAEQGATAGKQMLKVLKGVPIAQIPVAKNYEGIKMVNVTVMRSLGIAPRADRLRDVKLVTTAE